MSADELTEWLTSKLTDGEDDQTAQVIREQIEEQDATKSETIKSVSVDRSR